MVVRGVENRVKLDRLDVVVTQILLNSPSSNTVLESLNVAYSQVNSY